MKKFLVLFNLIFFSYIIGGIFSAYTGASPYVAIPSVGLLTFVSAHFVTGSGFAYASQDLSALARYAHQFQKQLISTLVNGLDIAMDIPVIPNIKSSMKLPKIKVGDGFRPYSANTEFYTGDVVYSDRELKVDVGKREILVDPEAYRHTYLSLVNSPGSGANKMDIPFAQYLWNEVIKNVAREINDEVAYFGFDKTDAVAYSEASTYTAGDYITYTLNSITEYYVCLSNTSAGEDPVDTPAKWQKVTARAVVPGLKDAIETAISGAALTATATGVIDNTTGKEAHAAFLKLFRAMPVPYKRAGVIIHCSFTDWEYLLDDLKTQFQYTVADMSNMQQNGMLPLPLTSGKGWVKPATWLGSSRRLIAEPIDMARAKGVNLVMGTDLLSDANEIKTKENLWTLEAGIKFVCGFQVSDLDALKVGDQS